MRILSIIYCEFLKNIRDIKNFIIMIIMPITLAVVLALVFKDEFNSNSYNVDILDYININIVNNTKEITSLDYYGLSMIALSLLFCSVLGAYKIIKDREIKVLQKLLISPTSIIEILSCKFFSLFISSFIQIVITVFICSKFLDINLGNKSYLTIIAFLSLSSLAISFGLFIGIFLKDNKSCFIILLSIIMILGLFGGAFIPLDLIQTSSFRVLSNISPITYIIRSILNIIYLNNIIPVMVCSSIFIFLSIIILVVSSIILEVKK